MVLDVGTIEQCEWARGLDGHVGQELIVAVAAQVLSLDKGKRLVNAGGVAGVENDGAQEHESIADNARVHRKHATSQSDTLGWSRSSHPTTCARMCTSTRPTRRPV